MLRYAVVLFFILASAHAVEPLKSDVLLQQCSSEDNVSRLACRSWIQGFMGGAYAIRTGKETKPVKKETFSERAARTRMAPRRDLYGLNYDAKYCVPSGTTIEELADKLIAYAGSLKQVSDHANQLMLGLLRKHYPCEKMSN